MTHSRRVQTLTLRGGASKHPITNTKITKPAVSWPGGKSRLLKYILPLIPDHTAYVEPFGGGLAVFLAKEKSKVEVINDLNGDLVNFYRVVRFHLEPLLTEIEFVLNSREEFNAFRLQPGLTDIQRAARWFFRNKTCFGGTDMRSFGISAVSGGGASQGSRATRVERIRGLNARLDGVCIEHLDWQKCVDLYDRPGTLFFLDPPYIECSDTTYAAWQPDNVVELKSRLDRLQGKWIVTLNDSPVIRSIFEGCHLIPVERAKGINNRNPKSTRYRELIIVPPGQAAECTEHPASAGSV